MKPFIFGSLIVFALSSLHAEDITTTDGTKHSNVTISRAEPDGLVVMTDSGIEKIPFAILPKELQTKYGYDADKAAKFALAAQTAATQRQAAVQSFQQQKAAQAAHLAQTKEMHIEINQVVSGGVLADPLAEQFTEAVGNSLGNGGGASGGGKYYERSWKVIFVQGVNGSAEGNQLTIKAYLDGTYAFRDNKGANRTVEKWVLVK